MEKIICAWTSPSLPPCEWIQAAPLLDTCQGMDLLLAGALPVFPFWYSSGANNSICNSLSMQQSVSATWFCSFSCMVQSSWFPEELVWVWDGIPVVLLKHLTVNLCITSVWCPAGVSAGGWFWQNSALKAVAGHRVFLCVWAEFFWVSNKCPKAVVTLNCLSLSCGLVQLCSHLKNQPKTSGGRSCVQARLQRRKYRKL